MSRVSVITVPYNTDEPLTLRHWADNEDEVHEQLTEFLQDSDYSGKVLEDASNKFNTVRLMFAEAKHINKRAIILYRMFSENPSRSFRPRGNAVIRNSHPDDGEPRDLPDKFIEQLQAIFGPDLQLGTGPGGRTIVDLGD